MCVYEIFQSYLMASSSLFACLFSMDNQEWLSPRFHDELAVVGIILHLESPADDVGRVHVLLVLWILVEGHADVELGAARI